MSFFLILLLNVILTSRKQVCPFPRYLNDRYEKDLKRTVIECKNKNKVLNFHNDKKFGWLFGECFDKPEPVYFVEDDITGKIVKFNGEPECTAVESDQVEKQCDTGVLDDLFKFKKFFAKFSEQNVYRFDCENEGNFSFRVKCKNGMFEFWYGGKMLDENEVIDICFERH
ncbi:hypothetical protein MHBO_003250 [Bonamia ostreae]|uniref:Uncharacterized protein n=1 Tax=Bonamia ostreae TaxID=126728 RepID=A0ABV2APW8_9EUKA